MYDKLNITENHLQVLSLFTNGFNREYYIREVRGLLKISPRTAQLILNDLENRGVLESKTKGKIRAYVLKRNGISRGYVVLTEQYKEVAFLEKNLMAREITEKIKPFVKGIGVIFGSYASQTADKYSDMDVFIAGDHDKDEIKKISETYNIDISVKSYPRKLFEDKLGTDILLKEVLKNHVVFSGTEQFVDMVMKTG